MTSKADKLDELRTEAFRVLDRMRERVESNDSKVLRTMDITNLAGEVPVVNVFDFPLADDWQEMTLDDGTRLGWIKRLANGGDNYLETHWKSSEPLAMGPHTHTMKEVMVVRWGTMYYTINGKEREVRKGESITIDKGVVHSVRTQGPASCWCAWFK